MLSKKKYVEHKVAKSQCNIFNFFTLSLDLRVQFLSGFDKFKGLIRFVSTPFSRSPIEPVLSDMDRRHPKFPVEDSRDSFRLL